MVDEGATLTFSYVGYTTESRTVGSSNTINVTLGEDVAQLEEVVVTAQGITREKKLLDMLLVKFPVKKWSKELKVMLPEFYLEKHLV